MFFMIYILLSLYLIVCFSDFWTNVTQFVLRLLTVLSYPTWYYDGNAGKLGGYKELDVMPVNT